MDNRQNMKKNSFKRPFDWLEQFKDEKNDHLKLQSSICYDGMF